MPQILEPGEVNVRVENLRHFLKLAKQGRCRGSSGGEKRCARLARLILDEVPGLDGQAVAGLIQLIHFTNAKPASARELLE